MQKPSERHKLTSDNNIIKCKKPVHDPFNSNTLASTAQWPFRNRFGHHWNKAYIISAACPVEVLSTFTFSVCGYD